VMTVLTRMGWHRGPTSQVLERLRCAVSLSTRLKRETIFDRPADQRSTPQRPFAGRSDLRDLTVGYAGCRKCR